MFDATYHLSTSAKTPKPVTEHSRLLPVVVPWDKKNTLPCHGGQFQTLKPMVKVLKKKWWVSIVDTKTGFKVPTPKNLSKTYSRSYWNKHVFQQHVGKKTASHYSLSDQVDELVANWKKLSVGCWTRCVFNVLRCPFAQRKETIVYMSSLHDP